MAEIFLLTRGHKDHVEKWERSMRSQFFPMKVKKKLKDELGREFEVDSVEMIEAQLRPYQLWGYVVPNEMVQPVCNNLGIPTNETWFNQSDEDKAESGKGNSFISGMGIKAQLTALRIALGAEKLPEIDLSKGTWAIPIYRNFVNVLGIGWRSDKTVKTILGTHEGI